MNRKECKTEISRRIDNPFELRTMSEVIDFVWEQAIIHSAEYLEQQSRNMNSSGITLRNIARELREGVKNEG